MSWLDPMCHVTVIENPDRNDPRRFIAVERTRLHPVDYDPQVLVDPSAYVRGDYTPPPPPTCVVCDDETLQRYWRDGVDVALCSGCFATINRPESWWLRLLRWCVR